MKAWSKQQQLWRRFCGIKRKSEEVNENGQGRGRWKKRRRILRLIFGFFDIFRTFLHLSSFLFSCSVFSVWKEGFNMSTIVMSEGERVYMWTHDDDDVDIYFLTWRRWIVSFRPAKSNYLFIRTKLNKHHRMRIKMISFFY
jgi:hypothetical protein